MTLDEYMQRRCVCGRLRREHQHYRDGSQRLRILPSARGATCPGFTDELELEFLANYGRPPTPMCARLQPAPETPPETPPEPIPLGQPHPQTCNCLPCMRLWDYGVDCSVCGADKGADCFGLESGIVHFARRVLGQVERKWGDGERGRPLRVVPR